MFERIAQSFQSLVTAVNNMTKALQAIFPSTAWTTSSSATAGAATLPANPVGFFNVTDANGVARKIPFYNA